MSTAEFGGPFQGILDALLEKGQTLFESLRPHMREPWVERPLEILVVDNPEFNAFADAGDNSDRIYIFRGAVEHVYGTMLGLLSDPTFLPAIGDPSVEEMPTEFDECGFPPMPLLGHDPDPSKQVRCYFPNDRRRSLFAQMLADVALEFLLLHEVGHVAAGHLELLEASTGQPAISEFRRSFAGSGTRQLSHVLECDADAFACHVSSYVQTRPEMGEILQDIWEDTAWDARHRLLISYLCAIGSLFRGLFPDAPTHVPAADSSHPHPAVRTCIVSSWTLGRAIYTKFVGESDLDQIVRDSLRNIEEVWAQLCLPGQVLQTPEVWSNAITESARSLVRAHADAKAALEQHARLPRRWDDWEWPAVDEPA